LITDQVHDVAVIGAGPYGLAATAHLRAKGLDVRALGRPMELWHTQMPEGMCLRSSWEASSIADPQGALSLDAYEQHRGSPVERPIPLTDFLDYARWFQRSAVPDVDERRVVHLGRSGDGFELELEDGDGIAARRVVIGTGPADFPRQPREFSGVPQPLVRHSVDVRDLSGYRGLSTVVIGGGQSAIELAALLSESDADVEVLARAGRIRWLRRSGWLHGRDGVVRRVLYPPTDVGPVGLSWVVAVPGGFRHIPVRLGEKIAYRCIRPAAAGWLVPRMAAVNVTLGRTVTSAREAGERVRLRLDDGTSREVDRVVLATGFDVRVESHPLIAADVAAVLRTRDGSPLLGRGLESSVPGLHFVGAFAAASFGPVMRFVSGTPFTARALAAHIRGTPRTWPIRPRPAAARA
jgi:cation diffusion facilitator CzcD-associated flavoprotein CzcO